MASIKESTVKKVLSRRVKSMRKSENLSQVEFAKKIGLTDKGLREIEHAESKFMPSLSSLIKIANGFGITLETLLFGIERE